MKNIFTTLLLSLYTCILLAQTPQGINYQAVARKSNGEPIVNTNVNVQFRILNGGVFGNEVYREEHTNINTNAFGLFSLKIGGGRALSGTFSGINWANGAKFLEVTVQSSFGTVTGGATEMLSVPYALYAASGNPGPKGDKGDPGLQGIPGLKGDKGDPGPAGAVATSSNASIEQAASFQSNVRNTWLDLSNQVQVTVPTTGKYLVFAGLKTTNISSEDRPAFRVIDVVSGTIVIQPVLIKGFTGESEAQNSYFSVKQLTAGSTLRLQGRLDAQFAQPQSLQVFFSEGRLSIIKIE